MADFDAPVTEIVTFGCDFTLRQNPDTVKFTAHKTTRDKRIFCDLCFRIQFAGVDEFLHKAQVHNSVFFAVWFIKPALRQTLVERHLPAFITIYRTPERIFDL